MTSPTQIKKLKSGEIAKTQCYICDEQNHHQFWDPESNGFICKGCLSFTLNAEELLTGTEGFSRPAVATNAGDASQRNNESKRGKAGKKDAS